MLLFVLVLYICCVFVCYLGLFMLLIVACYVALLMVVCYWFDTCDLNGYVLRVGLFVFMFVVYLLLFGCLCVLV